MTKEELRAKIREIEAGAERGIRKIKIEYARYHNQVKIGDVVADHFNTIKVERMRVSIGFGERPQMIYSGPMLTKKGEAHKNGKEGSICQSNLKTINGEAVE